MRHTVLAILLLFFAIPHQGKAQIQNRFNVQVFASPSNYFRVKIDDQLQELGSKFWVEPGVHKFEIWAPDHIAFDTIVMVPNGQILKFGAKLEKLPEYSAYKEQLDVWNGYKTKSNVGKVGVVVGVLGLAINHFNVNQKNFDYVKYKNGIDYDFDGYRPEGLETAESELRKAKNIQYVFGAIALGFGTYTYLNIRKYRSVNVPDYKTDRTFELTNIGMMYLPSTGLNFGLTLNF